MEVVWDVLPIDYSKEKENNIKVKVSNKLNLPLRNVKVNPRFIMMNKDGEKVALTNDTIQNIQDPKFQQELFKQYLAITKKDVEFDWDTLMNIDAEVNQYIDYSVYDKYKRYSIKWIRWSNFLSYGKDNYFDFTKLHGMVLVNGKPANQSGKTTFAVELLRFLLFGKTTKFKTMDGLFNINLPEETEVLVEGEINIDGIDYVIRRTLNRPSKKRRTEKSKVTQKIDYFKVEPDGTRKELQDIESCNEESGTLTNKAIKEAIGNEDDFDLIICATNDNLRELVSFKDTERGRLLSRWIGLLPLEEKEKIAKERMKNIARNSISSVFNRETLRIEINNEKESIQQLRDSIKRNQGILVEVDKTLESYKKNYNLLLESRKSVDPSISNIHIESILNNIESIKEEGIRKKNLKEQYEARLAEIPEVDYSEQQYMDCINRRAELKNGLYYDQQLIATKTKEKENLINSEYCPVCKRKFDNVDNTPLINEKIAEIEQLTADWNAKNDALNAISNEIANIENLKRVFDERSKLSIEVQSLTLVIDNLRQKLINLINTKKSYEQNKEAIEYNSKVSIEINNAKARMDSESNGRDNLIRAIQSDESAIKSYEQAILDKENKIKQIEAEEVALRHWNLYIDMVGKNGISKMVLRQTLPIINAELRRLLSDVCNIEVNVDITDKNDVIFTYSKDGGPFINISATSGLEVTIASLALRTVLANISTMPRLNFVVFDEIWGCVSKDNLMKMKDFFEKIISNYDFIIQISHDESIEEWHNTIISVVNKNGVSSIQVER